MRSDGRRRRLLVEGRDDKWVVINLMTKLGTDWEDEARSPHIEDCEGFPSLRENANSTLFKSMDVVGIIVDADMDAQRRWSSLSDRLREAEIPMPVLPCAGGWVGATDDARCRVGVWLMPNNELPGVLEDLVATLVPQGDGLWQHATLATRDAIELGAPIALAATSKAELHAWLAWQERPGVPMGQAISSRVLSHDSPLAREFADWFNRLFV